MASKISLRQVAAWERIASIAAWMSASRWRQIEAGCLDQAGERWDGGLPLPGLIRADHALRDTRPGGQAHLGQAGPLSRLAEQGSRGGRFHAVSIADRR